MSASTSTKAVRANAQAAPTLPRRVFNPFEAAPKGRKLASAWTCLVLSHDSARRLKIANAAAAAGWRPLCSATVDEATRLAQRWATQLVAVDFVPAAAADASSVREFTESVAIRERLVVVCDDTPDATSEAWARQVGAWLYLPSPDMGAPMAELFSEALSVAKKLGPPERAEIAPADRC